MASLNRTHLYGEHIIMNHLLTTWRITGADGETTVIVDTKTAMTALAHRCRWHKVEKLFHAPPDVWSLYLGPNHPESTPLDREEDSS